MSGDSTSASAMSSGSRCCLSQSPTASSRSARSSGVRDDCDPETLHWARNCEIAVSCFAVSRIEPRARADASTSNSRAASSLALRATAEAGLLSSWASPAARRPSGRIFSSWKSLLVKRRARSSMTWTKIAVSSWQRLAISLKQSRWIASSSQVSSAVVIPGGAVRREYGSRPLTSPARHSSTLRAPVPRSTRIAR